MALSNPYSKSCDSNNGKWVSHWRATPGHLVVTVGCRTGWLILGTQMTWKYPKTQKTQPQERNVCLCDSRVPMKMFLGQNVFVYAEWNLGGRKLFFCGGNCMCEGFYISLSAFRETEGGRKYCWMVKQHDCAIVRLCFLKREEGRDRKRRDREGNKERERERGPSMDAPGWKDLTSFPRQTLWLVFAYVMYTNSTHPKPK